MWLREILLATCSTLKNLHIDAVAVETRKFSKKYESFYKKNGSKLKPHYKENGWLIHPFIEVRMPKLKELRLINLNISENFHTEKRFFQFVNEFAPNLEIFHLDGNKKSKKAEFILSSYVESDPTIGNRLKEIHLRGFGKIQKSVLFAFGNFFRNCLLDINVDDNRVTSLDDD